MNKPIHPTPNRRFGMGLLGNGVKKNREIKKIDIAILLLLIFLIFISFITWYQLHEETGKSNRKCEELKISFTTMNLNIEETSFNITIRVDKISSYKYGIKYVQFFPYNKDFDTDKKPLIIYPIMVNDTITFNWEFDNINYLPSGFIGIFFEDIYNPECKKEYILGI